MKQLISFASAISFLLIAAMSCTDKSDLTPYVPQDCKLKLSVKDNPIVHYTDASVSGTITISGDIEEFTSSIERASSVMVRWGTDKNQLDNSTMASMNDASINYGFMEIPFTAQLMGLEDGEVYYYQVVGKCGSLEPKQTDVLKFFTLPEGAIDLDLKSGNLWCSQNLGATSPDEFGDYYAWGETQIKKTNAQYDWTNYKWCNGAYNKLTKYCSYSYQGYNGYTDDHKTLLDEDDAVVVNMGNGWHMPYPMDWTELSEQCGWTYVTINGINGWLIRSKKNPDDNKKVIFIPFAGYYSGASKRRDDSGYYWTKAVSNDYYYQDRAMYYFLSSYSYGLETGDRCCGETIRPVLSK